MVIFATAKAGEEKCCHDFSLGDAKAEHRTSLGFHFKLTVRLRRWLSSSYCGLRITCYVGLSLSELVSWRVHRS